LKGNEFNLPASNQSASEEYEHSLLILSDLLKNTFTEHTVIFSRTSCIP